MRVARARAIPLYRPGLKATFSAHAVSGVVVPYSTALRPSRGEGSAHRGRHLDRHRLLKTRVYVIGPESRRQLERDRSSSPEFGRRRRSRRVQKSLDTSCGRAGDDNPKAPAGRRAHSSVRRFTICRVRSRASIAWRGDVAATVRRQSSQRRGETSCPAAEPRLPSRKHPTSSRPIRVQSDRDNVKSCKVQQEAY